MTMARAICGVLAGRHRAATLAVALCVPAARAQGQVSVSAELQGAAYPQEAIGRQARAAEARGWVEVDYKRALSQRLELRADVIGYGLHGQRGLADGTVGLYWRTRRIELAGGLLRERLGRFANSDLDTLGPLNTLFSLVRPELRLSQPTLRTTAFFSGVAIDLYVLAGGRLQPVPEMDRRFGFGVPTRNIVNRGGMGDQAVALRVSGNKFDIDWSTHAYVGRSRRPTFVPRFTPARQVSGGDAVYTQIRQFGAELETTVADWRLVAEGFSREGAVNITGREQAYGHVAAAAEYQRLGALGGSFDFIPRFEVTADTRGDLADLPFASSVRVGTRIVKTALLPVQMEAAYAYDRSLRGHGVIASAEKALAESPTLRVGFRFTKFSRGEKPSVLDVWKRDFELISYLRIELSQK